MNEANEGVVWQKLCGSESLKPTKYKFNIGDQVRISKARRTFKMLKGVQQTFLYKLSADLKYETAILKDVYHPSLI